MIHVQDLTKQYGDLKAVDGISFSVEAGEVVGFLGPNGAGKSTTMRILTGFLHADGGHAEIAGRRVDPESPESKREVGYLPENTPLYARMRVADYLDFVGRARGLGRAARRSALERVVVDCSLEGHTTRRIAQLSKGYRQRVGLAQALLSDPATLILDEPTSGLDPAEIARIRGLIRQLGRTKTILLSTHVLSEVQEVCGRVVILAAGRIVADGTPLELAQDAKPLVHVTLRASTLEIGFELMELASVRLVRPRGANAEGMRGFTLEVTDRALASREVLQVVHAHPECELYELRHELPSLESVFLDRTESHMRSS